MRSLTLTPVLLLASLVTAQTNNLATISACSKISSIAQSCGEKLGEAVTATASLFNCICLDGSGKYSPTQWDDPASSCGEVLYSKYTTTANLFAVYATDFCSTMRSGGQTATTGSTVITTSSEASITGITLTPGSKPPVSSVVSHINYPSSVLLEIKTNSTQSTTGPAFTAPLTTVPGGTIINITALPPTTSSATTGAFSNTSAVATTSVVTTIPPGGSTRGGGSGSTSSGGSVATTSVKAEGAVCGASLWVCYSVYFFLLL
jgi:hypothetical protein